MQHFNCETTHSLSANVCTPFSGKLRNLVEKFKRVSCININPESSVSTKRKQAASMPERPSPLRKVSWTLGTERGCSPKTGRHYGNQVPFQEYLLYAFPLKEFPLDFRKASKTLSRYSSKSNTSSAMMKFVVCESSQQDLQ